MGSIQGLRSEAIALRAKEDTALTISSHLGGVNKALGNQMSSIIDQLQGVIAERTKAYNTSMVKISQTIYGKTGIGEKSTGLVFGMIGFAFDLAAPTPDPYSSSNTSGETKPQKTARVLKNLADALALVSKIFELRSSVNAAVFSYEKGASQIGFTYIENGGISIGTDDTLPNDATGYSDAGAVNLVNKRNALMPTYRSNNYASIVLNNYSQNYIGALRKR